MYNDTMIPWASVNFKADFFIMLFVPTACCCLHNVYITLLQVEPLFQVILGTLCLLFIFHYFPPELFIIPACQPCASLGDPLFSVPDLETPGRQGDNLQILMHLLWWYASLMGIYFSGFRVCNVFKDSCKCFIITLNTFPPLFLDSSMPALIP